MRRLTLKLSDIYLHFSPNIFFSWKDVLKLKSMKPDIFKLNAKIKRNEGATMKAKTLEKGEESNSWRKYAFIQAS